MNKEVLVSIIIPIYNSEKYLERCLKSISNQYFTDFECIMINDGSVDNSEKICLKYSQIDDRFIYCRKENGGVSTARNTGLEICNGEYICFVDADDFIENNTISVLHNIMVENNLDFVQCTFTRKTDYSNDTTYKNDLQIYYGTHIYDEVMNMYGKLIPFVAGGLFKSEIIGELRFDVNYNFGEDFLFLVNYLKNCSSVAHISLPLYHYIFNDESATQSKDKINLKKVHDTLESLESGLSLCKEKKHYEFLECRIFEGILNWIFYQFVKGKLFSRNNDISIYLKQKLNKNKKNYLRNTYIKKWEKICLLTGKLAPFFLALIYSIKKYVEKKKG